MSKFVSLLYSSLDFNRHARRYDAQERHAITTLFLLSGLYCLVALFFLLFFGFHAVLAGDMSYALMMFACACVTVASYFLLWKLGLYTWGGHLVVLLMAAMCLVLFYTGGEEATGPMWYLVFAVLAMFAQGRVVGDTGVGAGHELILVCQSNQSPIGMTTPAAQQPDQIAPMGHGLRIKINVFSWHGWLQGGDRFQLLIIFHGIEGTLAGRHQ